MHEKHSLKISGSQSECLRIEESLSAYLDNQLSQSERQTLELHLRSCVSCQRKLRNLVFSEKLLRSHDPGEPPERIWKEIQTRLRSEGVIRSTKGDGGGVMKKIGRILKKGKS